MSTKGQSPGAAGTLRPFMLILDMNWPHQLTFLNKYIKKLRSQSPRRTWFHILRQISSNSSLISRDKGNAPTSVRISEVKRLVIGCLISPLISFHFSSHIKRTTLFYVIYLIKHLDVRRKHSRRIFVSLLGVCHVLCLSCFFFLLQFFFSLLLFHLFIYFINLFTVIIVIF